MGLLNKILSALVLLFAIGCYVFFNQWQKENDRADRMTINYKDIANSNNVLSLRYNELNKDQKQSFDSVINLLNIKPKNVIEYVNVFIRDTIHDTIETKLILFEPFTYKFIQDTGCFHLEGLVNNKNEIPKLMFTDLEYNNSVEYLIYEQRKQWQFLFIKSRLFGKKENKLETFSKCGSSTVQKINIIKL